MIVQTTAATWARRAAAGVGLIAITGALAAGAGNGRGPRIDHFDLVSTYQAPGGIAEIVAATPDGRTLVYTDSGAEELGIVDIRDVNAPRTIARLATDGEPTSVTVTPDGAWALAAVNGAPSHVAVVSTTSWSIVDVIEIDGQPDSIAITKDGSLAAIVVENEREDVMPDLPSGYLAILDLSSWSLTQVDLTRLSSRFPTDAEPEFVDINGENVAAVTLQENNHVALIDLETAQVVGSFSAGTTTHAADLDEDGQIIFDDMLINARREPDAIHWTPGGRLATANEGDYTEDLAAGEYVGGRDFTIFNAQGAVVFEPGASLEMAAAAEGYYPDDRSADRGIETEGVEVGMYRDGTFLFVGAERGNFVAVYDLSDETTPALVQLLPTGARPEGLVAVEGRDLLVAANEDDGTISMFRARRGVNEPIHNLP